MSFSQPTTPELIGFNEPVIADNPHGPFRTTASDLTRVEFDLKHLKRWQRRFIESLPKGVAIIGGFARGIYLGSTVAVGDIDLAVPQNGNSHLISRILERFLEDNKFYPYAPYSEFIGRSDEPYTFQGTILTQWFSVGDDRGFVGWHETRPVGDQPDMLKCNAYPIKKKYPWGPRLSVDVLLAPPGQELTEFLNRFDISIRQFAYLNGQLYATRIAVEDVKKGQFRFLCRHNKDRAEKYIKKGYKMID